MIIVAGHLVVDPAQRESYLAGCVGIVQQARAADGCLDFSITADLLDDTRIDVYERWSSRQAVEAFRGSGPEEDQGAVVRAASVAEYDVSETRTLT